MELQARASAPLNTPLGAILYTESRILFSKLLCARYCYVCIAKCKNLKQKCYEIWIHDRFWIRTDAFHSQLRFIIGTVFSTKNHGSTTRMFETKNWRQIESLMNNGAMRKKKRFLFFFCIFHLGASKQFYGNINEFDTLERVARSKSFLYAVGLVFWRLKRKKAKQI